MWQSGAEVSSTRWRSPWVNLRRSLRVGAWNVLSLREDDRLSVLSSEVRRPDSGEIMAGVCSYDWSGRLMVTMPKELL